ncbi:hypothetical protein DRJ12_01080, partial [Candidatus Acetothermia bacterium]
MKTDELLREYGFDLETQKRAHGYQLAVLRMKAVRYAALACLLLLFAAFGSGGLVRALGGGPASGWGLNALYVLVFAIGLSIVDLPFDLWDYSIERRYGLSTQGPKSFFADWLKSGAINLIILIIAFPAIYLGFRDSNLWWVISWAIATGFIIFMGFISPILLMPLFFKFEPLADAELVGRLKKLAERAGVKVLGVFKMKAAAKTRRATGALTGIGATRRIILSDTLLENYTPDEIETVIAHELGHHAHKDIWKGTFSFSAMAFVALLAVHLALPPLARALGLGMGIETLPLFLTILGGIFAILKPLYNTISR